MVWGEHDNNFKELNSQVSYALQQLLKCSNNIVCLGSRCTLWEAFDMSRMFAQLLREAKVHDWTSAQPLIGEAAAAFSKDASFIDPADIMAVTSQQSGQKLGGKSIGMDAKTAAALSALQRAGQTVGDPPLEDMPSAPSEAETDGIDGLEHQDDRTEELEQEMRALCESK